MATVAAALAHVEAAEQKRAVRREGADKYARFYRSRAWASKKFSWLASLRPEERRCALCGASSKDARLVVDHVIPLKDPSGEGWRRRLIGPYQVLRNEHNILKASKGSMNFRTGKEEQTNVG